MKFQHYIRALEEIDHLNVEVRRLRTSMHDEADKFAETIQSLRLTDPPLGAELQKQWKLRSAVNSVHSDRLDRIEGLYGFSGVRGVGVREGQEARPAQAAVRPTYRADNITDEGNVIEDDEEACREFEGMTDFILGITD
jgi:hypothetical protein